MTIPLVLTEEHEALRDAVRGFLAERAPMSAVRQLAESTDGAGYDSDLWQQMAKEMELQGLGIPEEHGGAGAGPVEVGLVFEEMGRALTCSPYFATVALAVPAILAARDAAASADLLPGIASGATVATVALVGADDDWSPEGMCITAESSGEGHRLSGSRSFVVDGAAADLILVLADAGAGPTLFAVDADASGVERTSLETLDLTRRLASIEFDKSPARQVGDSGDGWRVIETALEFAGLALAAESSGGAQRCLEMATEYAGQRVQFGRIIGSFQAIKHMCADMLLDVEGSRAASSYAAWAAAEQWDDRHTAASVATRFCGQAYNSVAAGNIQVHGGIGFTWEHDAHLYFRRAKSSELLLGRNRQRRLLEERIGLKDG